MSQSDDGQVLVDFLSHAEIVVQAPPKEVWAAVADTNGWHGTRMVHVDGPVGEVGERFHVTPADQPDMVMLHADNVELVPERRRTIRIHTADGTFTGYSSWILQDRGAETSVTYDVFCRYPFPREMVDGLGALAQQQNEEGLRRLKAFVETGEAA